jgi:transposase
MVYRFLSTLKKTEVKTPAEPHQALHYTSKAAVCLFMQHPDALDEDERVDLAALRQAHPDLEAAYGLTQDFLQMVRKLERERLDTWLTQVHESQLGELESFARGVEQDKAAVQAGLTLQINNGQVEGHVTRIKLIKRMNYGKAGFALLRQGPECVALMVSQTITFSSSATISSTVSCSSVKAAAAVIPLSGSRSRRNQYRLGS